MNALAPESAVAELLSCCGSAEWARRLADRRPFADTVSAIAEAEAIWAGLSEGDLLEAFAAHPRIGGAAAPREAEEQAGVRRASRETREALADGNRRYEAKFGFVFLMCATGKTADEMLAALEWRLGNDRETELEIAAEEQRMITRLRLEKLLG